MKVNLQTHNGLYLKFLLLNLLALLIDITALQLHLVVTSSQIQGLKSCELPVFIPIMPHSGILVFETFTESSFLYCDDILYA